MLSIVNKEGVLLVVVDYIINTRKNECPHRILTIPSWVDIEVLKAVTR